MAEHLAATGRKVAAFEEHHTIGEPLHCAGLITPRVLTLANCPQDAVVQNTIYGAIIHSPDDSSLTIGGDKIHALVINRQRFDAYLAHKAKDAGAMIRTNQKVIAVKHHHTGMVLDIQSDDRTTSVQCQMVIGADGVHSRIRSCFGFPKPVELLHGISAEVSDTTLDPNYVHIFVGSTIAPGFFAWVIPTNPQGTTARIGLCIGKHKTHSLQQCFTTLLQHPLLHDATEQKRFGGAIPLGPLKKTADDHVMLVGDAAGQVKPTSGGGLYPGLRCAQHCCAVAEEAFQTQRFDEAFLRRYHTRWTKDIGRELALGMQFRRIFIRLTDSQFNKYLDKLNTTKTIDVINTYGDIDYPSRLALPLIRTNPSLLSLVSSLLKHRKT